MSQRIKGGWTKIYGNFTAVGNHGYLGSHSKQPFMILSSHSTYAHTRHRQHHDKLAHEEELDFARHRPRAARAPHHHITYPLKTMPLNSRKRRGPRSRDWTDRIRGDNGRAGQPQELYVLPCRPCHLSFKRTGLPSHHCNIKGQTAADEFLCAPIRKNSCLQRTSYHGAFFQTSPVLTQKRRKEYASGLARQWK